MSLWYPKPVKRSRSVKVATAFPEPKKAETMEETKNLFKFKRSKRGLCFLCIGHGMLKDAKTGSIRTCLCCNGSGRLKSKA